MRLNSDPNWGAGAVSPVIAVMLMLVVTIIIAAVVSGYSGGLVKGQDTAPSAAIDVTIKNTGEWKGSYIQFDVKSVNEPFSSGDLKIVTAWTSTSGTSGGNTTMKGLNSPNTRTVSTYYQSPLGYGPGIENWVSDANSSYIGGYPGIQQFGNYSITAGTTMKAMPFGGNSTEGGYGVSTPYEYSAGSEYTNTTANYDGMQAVLGKTWYTLRAGDTVRVMIMHVPSGKTIYSKNIPVVG